MAGNKSFEKICEEAMADSSYKEAYSRLKAECKVYQVMEQKTAMLMSLVAFMAEELMKLNDVEPVTNKELFKKCIDEAPAPLQILHGKVKDGKLIELESIGAEHEGEPVSVIVWSRWDY